MLQAAWRVAARAFLDRFAWGRKRWTPWKGVERNTSQSLAIAEVTSVPFTASHGAEEFFGGICGLEVCRRVICMFSSVISHTAHPGSRPPHHVKLATENEWPMLSADPGFPFHQGSGV
jgi:hypothetical protein